MPTSEAIERTTRDVRRANIKNYDTIRTIGSSSPTKKRSSDASISNVTDFPQIVCPQRKDQWLPLSSRHSRTEIRSISSPYLITQHLITPADGEPKNSLPLSLL